MDQKEKKDKVKILVFAKNIDSGTGLFAFQTTRLKEFEVKLYFLEKRYKRNRLNRAEFFNNKPAYRGYYFLSPALIIELIREVVWLKKMILLEKPDVIMSLNSHCNFIAIMEKILFFKEIKVISITDNNISEVVKAKMPFIVRPIIRVLGSILLSRADALACASKGSSFELKRFFFLKKRVETIYYGVSEKKTYKPIARNKDSCIKLISVGRLEAQKDFSTLLNAFKLVVNADRDVTLKIVGDGSDRQSLEQLVVRLGLSHRVKFLGWKENIYHHLKNSDVFVFSSLYEGFGLTLVEAMSVGLPVVSTNTPHGPSEILGNGKYGMLVPVRNEEKLAEAILGLVQNKEKRSEYARKAKERSSDFTESKVLHRYRKLISDTLQ